MSSCPPQGRFVPLNVTPCDEDRVLRITWRDGHHGIFPYSFLRSACPCVICKGRHGPVVIGEMGTSDNIILVDLLPQGNYALRVLWNDAHQTGIYTYEYLRIICRCEECCRST